MHKQASWQLTYYFISYKCKWTSAYATCLRRKKLHCLRACLRTPTRTVKYQVNSLRSCIRSSLEYMRLVIGKKTMLTWWFCLTLLPVQLSHLARLKFQSKLKISQCSTVSLLEIQGDSKTTQCNKLSQEKQRPDCGGWVAHRKQWSLLQLEI